FVCRSYPRAAATAGAASAARRDVGLLRGHPIVDGHFSAIYEIGILRVRRGHAVLLNAHRMPIVKRDLAIHTATVDTCRTGVLLATAKPVGKCIVRRHVIHRRG